MKKITIVIVSALSFLLLTACGSNAEKESSSKKTEITLLIGKEEIATELDETIQAYNNSQDKYKVTTIPLAGQNLTEKMTSLYASKNAPVMINPGVYTEIEQWKDKWLDLSDLDFIKDIDSQYLAAGNVDGKQIGIPSTVEGFGFLYNKEVLDKAVDGDFDPNSIQTKSDLEDLMNKIESTGKNSIEISSMDWSLGAHYTNILFTNQSDTPEGRMKFINKLKAGKEDLTSNPVYNEWVDLFDLMKKHNAAKDSPLSTDYDATTLSLANGDTGLWFMGSWVMPQLKEANPDATFGILPVPLTDNPKDFGNTRISIGVPSTWAIDGFQTTKKEQAGAKDFLTWMYDDKEGQKYYVKKLGFIPINSNNTNKPKDSLSQCVLSYLKEDRGLEWMNGRYPSTGNASMGASLQKYLSNDINRDTLAKELENYWKKTEE